MHDLKNLDAPELKKLIPIHDPVGLGISDSPLYVCTYDESLKVYDIKNAYNPIARKAIQGN